MHAESLMSQFCEGQDGGSIFSLFYLFFLVYHVSAVGPVSLVSTLIPVFSLSPLGAVIKCFGVGC